MRVWSWFFSRRQHENDLNEEIQAHLILAARDRVERGEPPGDAERSARRELGNEALIKEVTRDVWGWGAFERLGQDVRYGSRLMKRSPGFALVAVLTLALGIGANSTVFSWIDAILLNPLPGVTDSERIVALAPRGNPLGSISYPDLADLRQRNTAFSGFIAFGLAQMSLGGTGKPERVWGILASANYFDVLGVQPLLGRGFSPDEDQLPNGAPVAVISYGLWQRRFGADPAILGHSIRLNSHVYTIVGVAPRGFLGSFPALAFDIWVPLMMAPQVLSWNNVLESRAFSRFVAMGRLKSDVNRTTAQANLNIIMDQIVRRYPESHKGWSGLTIDPLWTAGSNSFLAPVLLMLMMVAVLVLLLASANVANLLLARAVERCRELAIRLSLGAGRMRIVRQLLVESILLAMCGGAAALLVTRWSSSAFHNFTPPSNLPIWLAPRVDYRVLLATLLFALVTGLIFGVLPAFRASRTDLVSGLKDDATSIAGSRRKLRLANSLVVAQISVSLMLLICAGLFIESFKKAQALHPGFNPRNVLVASYDLLASGYSVAQGFQFDQTLLARLEALPGVQSVSLADWVPLGFSNSGTDFIPEGYQSRPNEPINAGSAAVTQDYFHTVEIPFVLGRDFTFHDTAQSQSVVIINQALADRYWPHQNPVGKRLQLGGTWTSVIGVVQNSRYHRLDEQPLPFIYVPLFQSYSPNAIIHVRTFGDPMSLAAAVENAVHRLNPDLPVCDVGTLEARIQVASGIQRIAASTVGVFGFLALLLASVGIYGVVAYTTKQRTREIGIRVALGASRRDIFGLVIGQAAWLTLVGLGIGLGASLLTTRLLSSFLFGVSATDPLTFAGVSFLLAAVSLAACYLPARKAIRLDPTIALRYE